jgi:hypothetical protein
LSSGGHRHSFGILVRYWAGPLCRALALMTAFGSSPANGSLGPMTHCRPALKPARFLSALVVLAAGACLATLDEAAAAYKSAPNGTQITYSDRTCTVVDSSNGFLRCRLESGETYTRAYGLEIVGPLKPHGDFLTFLSRTSCAGRITRVRELELSDREAKKLGALWPLEVGKSSDYSITAVTNGGFGDNEANGRFRIRAKVESRESLTTPAGTFDVFVIVQTARASCAANKTTNSVGYERKFWFAPNPGIIVKETVRWTRGHFTGAKKILR